MCLAVMWQHKWLDTMPPVSEATSLRLGCQPLCIWVCMTASGRMTRYSVGSEIGRNNSHTDLSVVHRRQPVPACFIYERLMNRYPLHAVTLANWPEVSASASPHRVSHTTSTGNWGWCCWGEFGWTAQRCCISPNKRWIWGWRVNGGCKHRTIYCSE